MFFGHVCGTNAGLRIVRLRRRRPSRSTRELDGWMNRVVPTSASRMPKSVNRTMILLIDNYDSFTYNLVQRFGEIDPTLPMKVVRNDQITLDEIAALKPTHIIISPGPVHAERGRHLQRRAEAVRADDADLRRVPGASVHRPHLRRRGDPQLPHHARQGVADPPRRPRASSRGCRTRSTRRAITRWSSRRRRGTTRTSR